MTLPESFLTFTTALLITGCAASGAPNARAERSSALDRPVADKGNAEGRANNRRVEIVIAKAP